MPVDCVFLLYECVRVFDRNSEDVFSAVSRDDLVAVLRVEILQFFQWSSCEFADLLEMQLLVDAERVHSHRHAYISRLDAVLLIIIECI